MNQLATSLLLLVTISFMLVHVYVPVYPWLVWVEAFTEAAMVGALADWFAVTALFRHPMGIPIPHTAIVSRNKDRIADTLGEFIETNFLTPEILRSRLEKIDVVAAISRWFSEEDRLKSFSHEVSGVILRALSTLGEDKVAGGIAAWMKEATSRSAILGKGVGSFIQALLEGDESGVLFERAVAHVRGLLKNHSEFLQKHIRKELPWYVPRFVHDRIYHSVISRLEEYFEEIVSSPTHPARAQFREYVAKLAHEISHSPRTQEKLSLWFHTALSDEMLLTYVKKVWRKVLSALEADHARGDSAEIARLIESFAKHLLLSFQDDAELRARGNLFVLETAVIVIDRHRAQVGGFIAQTMKTWDNETLVQKVEEKIGTDLQFVRINGTVVGGLVGVVLHGIKVLLP